MDISFFVNHYQRNLNWNFHQRITHQHNNPFRNFFKNSLEHKSPTTIPSKGKNMRSHTGLAFFSVLWRQRGRRQNSESDKRRTRKAADHKSENGFWFKRFEIFSLSALNPQQLVLHASSKLLLKEAVKSAAYLSPSCIQGPSKA